MSTSLEDIFDIPTAYFNSPAVDFSDACDATEMCDIEWSNVPSLQLSDSFRGVSMMLDRELFTHQTDARDDVFIPTHLKNPILALNNSKKHTRTAVETPSSSVLDSKTSFSKSSSVTAESSSLCPIKPARLLQTHIKLRLPKTSSFESLQQTLQELLDAVVDFDFRFDERAMNWRGKYLCGKKRCLVMVHLYCDLERNSGFVLEVVKTKGDAKVFHELFRQLSGALSESDFVDIVTKDSPSSRDCNASLSNKKSTRFACTSVPLSVSLSLDELLAHLETIDEMANCEVLEPRLHAAQLLCDLASIDRALLGEQVVVDKILQIVETLLFSSSVSSPSLRGFLESDLLALFEEEEEDVVVEIAEQALIALSLFCSATPAFQESLLIPLHRETLRLVAMMVSDAPSETAFLSAHLRRECALLLLSLAQFDAAVCAKQLQDSLSQSAQTWLETLGELRDTKLRNHGMILQNKLLAVM